MGSEVKLYLFARKYIILPSGTKKYNAKLTSVNTVHKYRKNGKPLVRHSVKDHISPTWSVGVGLVLCNSSHWCLGKFTGHLGFLQDQFSFQVAGNPACILKC